MPIKVKLDLRSLTDAQYMQKCSAIVAAMTGNTNFPTPAPALTAITAIPYEMQQLINQRSAAEALAQNLTIQIRARRDAGTETLNSLADYVESIANGPTPPAPPAAVVESAAMEVANSSHTPVGPMPRVEGLQASTGDQDGAVDLQWNAIRRGLRMYVAQYTTDPAALTGWTHAGNPTASRFTVSGLTSGTRYWFRVAAIGTAGQGPWSDPATRTAP